MMNGGMLMSSYVWRREMSRKVRCTCCIIDRIGCKESNDAGGELKETQAVWGEPGVPNG